MNLSPEAVRALFGIPDWLQLGADAWMLDLPEFESETVLTSRCDCCGVTRRVTQDKPAGVRQITVREIDVQFDFEIERNAGWVRVWSTERDNVTLSCVFATEGEARTAAQKVNDTREQMTSYYLEVTAPDEPSPSG